MATVPIEIVLQDAEVPVDPTPTPESGEETNIIVPNTGTISNDGSSNGGIGSSISIVPPIVIAVLALSAMVALLIRRQQKRKSNTEAGISKKEKLATATSGTIAILAATVLVGNLVIPATKAATNVEPGTAELETEDKITIIATREQDSDEVVATVKNTSYATANLDFGYKVTAAMAEGATTANLYLDGDETSEYYFSQVEDGILTDNAWGYTLEEPSEDTTYFSIPLTNNPTTIVKGSGEIEDEAVDIYYTIKVDKSLPTGTYTGELEYTLTDNNFPSTLTTMQGMTTEICENTFTPGNQATDPVPTATLRDIRDDKIYTIAKLADGNCWMTQNLDLDLNENIALTPENTDVSENWTPMRSTINFTSGEVEGWGDSSTTPYSANLNEGDVYYYTSNTEARDAKYNSLESCEMKHDDDTCSHYNVGNYYNWSAAVATNDASEMTERYSNAPDSICPRGWRLPKNANAESYIEGNEQITIVGSYNDILGEYNPWGPPGGMYSYKEGGFNVIRTAPLWLVRTGNIKSGIYNGGGEIGEYWSSTIYDDNGAYQLYFQVGTVFPSYDEYRRDYGYTIRCVTK